MSSTAPIKFRSPSSSEWQTVEFIPDTSKTADEEKARSARCKQSLESLKDTLLASLQMEHLCVLSGSGTSLGEVGGPSMSDLWNEISSIESNADGSGFQGIKDVPADGATSESSTQIQLLAKKIKFTIAENQNIEVFLSFCESYLQVHPDESDVKAFVTESRKRILAKCNFVTGDTKLEGHETFLHRLSRRRVRDSRLRLFTTNYDLCFERAASALGLIVVDGFSFSNPRHYDPKYFGYDIVRRLRNAEDQGSYLEGVIHLCKLHGSVNWERIVKDTQEFIVQNEKPNPDNACIVYPAKGKYQQSYLQPHLELISRYFESLREPNTCLLISGFGFNDSHLSEPILSAIRSNPHLRVIIADYSAEAKVNGVEREASSYWGKLEKLASHGDDIWFINASFAEFSSLIPDLRSLTKAERLAKDIQSLIGGSR